MAIIDVSKIPQDLKVYGGMSCKKIAIMVDGVRYLVKFHGNLKNSNMGTGCMDYSDKPVCEYIGSHIYALSGIPVHETVLAKRNQELVVLCKDFVEKGHELFEFSKIKVSFEPVLVNSAGEETDGQGSGLAETLQVLDQHPVFKTVQNAADRFWDMFIVDTFIGNPDRNDDNWGIISNGNKVTLAPVYDNGKCLSSKACEDSRCYYTGNAGKKINPFHLIASGKYVGCTEALTRFSNRINLGEVFKMIEEIPVLTNIQIKYYEEILKARADHLAMLAGNLQNNRTKYILNKSRR